MRLLKKVYIFLDSGRFFVLIIALALIHFIFGLIYLTTLIEKIKLTDYNNQLVRQNNQLNADISRMRLEIDEKVDLANIEAISREKLNMIDISQVNYIYIE